DATPGISRGLTGECFIRVGEAAFSIDPLSSQGIQCAVISAIQGASVVHTMLSPAHDSDAAVEFYESRQRSAMTNALRHATPFYLEGLRHFDYPFWSRRSSQIDLSSSSSPFDSQNTVTLPSSLTISPAVRFVDVPALSGDYIVRMRAISHP